MVDEQPGENAEPFNDTLHDAFFDTYWEWKKWRSEKGWELDTYHQ